MKSTILIGSMLALLGFSSTGCLAIGSVQTAQTLGQGNYEVSVEPGVYGTVVHGKGATLPNLNVGYRTGVTDRIDLGGRAGTTLAELQSKFLLSDPANEKLAVSLAPAIGGFTLGGGNSRIGLLGIPVPVLIGFKFGDHELTLGPRVQNVIAFAGGGNTNAGVYSLMLGTSVGFAAQLGKNIRIMPEIAFSVPVFVSAGGSSQSFLTAGPAFSSNAGALVYSANLGIQYGSPRKKHQKPPKEPSN